MPSYWYLACGKLKSTFFTKRNYIVTKYYLVLLCYLKSKIEPPSQHINQVKVEVDGAGGNGSRVAGRPLTDTSLMDTSSRTSSLYTSQRMMTYPFLLLVCFRLITLSRDVTTLIKYLSIRSVHRPS